MTQNALTPKMLQDVRAHEQVTEHVQIISYHAFRPKRPLSVQYGMEMLSLNDHIYLWKHLIEKNYIVMLYNIHMYGL